MAKLGSPLYILRNECSRDLMSVLEKLAEIGFEGIEFFGLFGHKPSSIRRKLDSCGISAIGDHVPVSFNDFTENIDEILEEHLEIGCKFISLGASEADYFPAESDYKRTLETLERTGETANKSGITLLYHNHANELRDFFNGKNMLENILDDTNPTLLYPEFDLGWMQIGGADPMYFLDKYKNRCPVIHFKDYIPLENDDFLFRPTGYGIVNNAELYLKSASFDTKPEWYVLDHDCAYERDIYFDMKISLEYFKNLIKVSQ